MFLSGLVWFFFVFFGTDGADWEDEIYSKVRLVERKKV